MCVISGFQGLNAVDIMVLVIKANRPAEYMSGMFVFYRNFLL